MSGRSNSWSKDYSRFYFHESGQVEIKIVEFCHPRDLHTGAGLRALVPEVSPQVCLARKSLGTQLPNLLSTTSFFPKTNLCLDMSQRNFLPPFIGLQPCERKGTLTPVFAHPILLRIIVWNIETSKTSSRGNLHRSKRAKKLQKDWQCEKIHDSFLQTLPLLISFLQFLELEETSKRLHINTPFELKAEIRPLFLTELSKLAGWLDNRPSHTN